VQPVGTAKLRPETAAKHNDNDIKNGQTANVSVNHQDDMT
jgi:hypothetical protein